VLQLIRPGRGRSRRRPCRRRVRENRLSDPPDSESSAPLAQEGPTRAGTAPTLTVGDKTACPTGTRPCPRTAVLHGHVADTGPVGARNLKPVRRVAGLLSFRRARSLTVTGSVGLRQDVRLPICASSVPVVTRPLVLLRLLRVVRRQARWTRDFPGEGPVDDGRRACFTSRNLAQASYFALSTINHAPRSVKRRLVRPRNRDDRWRRRSAVAFAAPPPLERLLVDAQRHRRVIARGMASEAEWIERRQPELVVT